MIDVRSSWMIHFLSFCLLTLFFLETEMRSHLYNIMRCFRRSRSSQISCFVLQEDNNAISLFSSWFLSHPRTHLSCFFAKRSVATKLFDICFRKKVLFFSSTLLTYPPTPPPVHSSLPSPLHPPSHVSSRSPRHVPQDCSEIRSPTRERIWTALIRISWKDHKTQKTRNAQRLRSRDILVFAFSTKGGFPGPTGLLAQKRSWMVLEKGTESFFF